MMKKPDLVEKVKDLAGLESKAAAERSVNAVLEAIEAGLQKDGEVQLIGFGTFRVKDRPAREGRNVKTGEKIKIKASKTVAFKVGAALKANATKKGGKKK
ncbi:MAG: HU family DNA-binding protein [Fibromonadales bacterium]|nr:HU family DNA-binding protein [Fibromonadales bacterium]